MSKIGMNPDEVRALSGQIDGQLGVLDGAQAAVALAGVISANPLQYLLAPGALILSPWSIAQTAAASVEIINARASAQELVGKLLAEAGAQEWASSDLDALYFEPVAWRTPDASKVPAFDPFDPNGPFSWIKNLVSTIADVWGTVETTFDGIKLWGEKTWKEIVDWWDKTPPWAKGLAKFGKLLPWAGTAITLYDLSQSWAAGDVGGNIRNVVSLITDVVSFVPGPVGWVSAVVGIVWDAGWMIGEDIIYTIENPTAMGEYYMEYPWMTVVHGVIPLTTQIWGPLAG